jgi:hypothetical protein
MIYPVQGSFSPEEEIIIFQIRQLIGDTEEVFIDDVITAGGCSRVSANGTIYELDEPKGYPINIYVDGVEYTSTSGTYGAQVLGDKYIRFTNTSGVLFNDSHLVVIYNHYRNSDLDILNTYDTSAKIYLTAQCNLSDEQLGPDLLVLSTAYALLTKDMSEYVKSAVNLEDSDSRFDASRRPDALAKLLDSIGKSLKAALEAKTRCSMLSLPVFKIE